MESIVAEIDRGIPSAEAIEKFKARGITSQQILDKHYADPAWIIPEIIPEGLTLIAGKSKTGKSWFALGLGAAFSYGGNVLGQIDLREVKGDVLYIALEDNQRRLRRRFDQLHLLGSEHLIFYEAWPRGKGCLEDLRLALKVYPNTKLVIIDTIARILPEGTDTNDYLSTYDFLSDLRQIASAAHIGIVGIGHCNKRVAVEDVFDSILGSTGIAAALDTGIVLQRGRGQADAVLHITGRDVEEKELAIRFDDALGWVLLGDAREYAQSKERVDILEVLLQADEPVSPKEIASTLEKNPGSVRFLMMKMAQEGTIVRAGYGKYLHSRTNTNTFPPPTVSGVSTKSRERELVE